MVKKFTKGIVGLFQSITHAEYSERSHQVELIGTYKNEDNDCVDVICTVQLKHYIPRDVYGEGGYFYEKERKRKVRNSNREWVTVTDTVTYYEMSEADKKFVYVSYVYHHLNQRQISKLSGIPQPYVYRYIKHNKLKPKYSDTPKSKRNIVLKDFGLDYNTKFETSFIEPAVELADDIDLSDKFHIDLLSLRSEWKVRREEYGLKNGENWRNTAYDENPGPRQYGDGSKSKRKKVAKQKRREKRRIKNIQKYNLHQNNRYHMTKENPNGDFNSNEGR